MQTNKPKCILGWRHKKIRCIFTFIIRPCFVAINLPDFRMSKYYEIHMHHTNYDLRYIITLRSYVNFKHYWSYIECLVQSSSYEVRNLLWCNTHLRFYCLYIAHAQDLLTKDKILIPLWMNYNLLNTMNHKYGIFKISFLIITNTICNIISSHIVHI